MEQNNKLTNQLFVLKIGQKNLRWKELTPSGAPPSERMLHSMTYLERMNILVVYGGRNIAKDCFLSDVHILKLESLQWAVVHIYGSEMNDGRCGHAAAGFNKRLVVFGGVNKQYFSGNIFVIDFDPFHVRKFRKEQQEKQRIKEMMMHRINTRFLKRLKHQNSSFLHAAPSTEQLDNLRSKSQLKVHRQSFENMWDYSKEESYKTNSSLYISDH